MLDVNTSKNNDGSRRPDSTDSLHLTPTHQEPHEHPWLSRAGYFLRGDELETLTLPESEGLSARNPTYFSRLFLSKFLGGSQQPAYTNVMFNHNHIYHLGAYYVGKTEWNPQFPKELGEHGALLVVGTSFERPPVPWPTSQEVYPGGHRAQFKPVNCFVKRSSAEYEYIGLYAFHAEFRKLMEREVEKHVPKAAWDLWTKGIDMSQWGAKLKCKLVATTNADNGNAQVGAPETRKAEELFKLPDDNPGKLCFYWQVVDSSLDIKNRLTAYGKEIGWTIRKSAGQSGNRLDNQEIGWTIRKSTVSGGLTRTEKMEEELTAEMERTYVDQSAVPMSSDEESQSPNEEPNVVRESEDLEQMVVKGLVPTRKLEPETSSST